jgi:hypothetical protein
MDREKDGEGTESDERHHRMTEDRIVRSLVGKVAILWGGTMEDRE